MPTYEYQAEEDCTQCLGHFEVFGGVELADLKHCPTCGKACSRVLSASGVTMGQAHQLKEKHFSERGFTQYKKIGKGVYEKTAGKGPAIIKDDGK
jgi:putative FmdB family regulatory protein